MLRRLSCLTGAIYLLAAALIGPSSRIAVPIAGTACLAGCILDMEDEPDSTGHGGGGDGCPPGPPI
jgi:disulfide bond formation protein DsbB